MPATSKRRKGSLCAGKSSSYRCKSPKARKGRLHSDRPTNHSKPHINRNGKEWSKAHRPTNLTECYKANWQNSRRSIRPSKPTTASSRPSLRALASSWARNTGRSYSVSSKSPNFSSTASVASSEKTGNITNARSNSTRPQSKNTADCANRPMRTCPKGTKTRTALICRAFRL
jgi:hypothetical protein